jgi:hypothetical protein
MFDADTTTTSSAGNTSTNSQPTGETSYPFRLLRDEVVLGTFPIARKTRPFGKLVSFIFVTDSRVVYSAEAKSVLSSSTQMKEYQVSTIKGFEVGRHRGFDAVSAASAIGVVLNFIGMLILTALVSSSGSSGGFGNPYGGYSSSPGSALGAIAGVIAAATLIVGSAAVFVMRRPSAEISVVGPEMSRTLAKQADLPALLLKIILFVIFGLFAGIAVIGWTALRELGIFRAEDAQSFADTRNIDHISYEVGALILDVQARGKLAGK